MKTEGTFTFVFAYVGDIIILLSVGAGLKTSSLLYRFELTGIIIRLLFFTALSVLWKISFSFAGSVRYKNHAGPGPGPCRPLLVVSHVTRVNKCYLSCDDYYY